jgi:hypothetical protein
MHPEIARELTAQRGRELRERACRASMARALSRKLRAKRRGAHEADDFVCPAIPDYVDGSFQTVSPADDKAAGQQSRVPAARRAA